MDFKLKSICLAVFLSISVLASGIIYGVNEKGENVFMPLNNRVIIIDPGHGGWEA